MQIKLLSVAGYTRQEIRTGYIRLISNYDWFGANEIVVCGWLHKTRDYNWLHKTLDFKLPFVLVQIKLLSVAGYT